MKQGVHAFAGDLQLLVGRHHQTGDSAVSLGDDPLAGSDELAAGSTAALKIPKSLQDRRTHACGVLADATGEDDGVQQAHHRRVAAAVLHKTVRHHFEGEPAVLVAGNGALRHNPEVIVAGQPLQTAVGVASCRCGAAAPVAGIS